MKRGWKDGSEAFAEAANRAAEEAIYPALFGVARARLAFETVRRPGCGGAPAPGGGAAAGRIVRVAVRGLRWPLPFTVRERWRPVRGVDGEDQTESEWYERAASLAELQRFDAGLLLYGFYDPAAGGFPDAVAAVQSAFLLALARGRLPPPKRRGGPEVIVRFSLADLAEAGVALWRQDGRGA